MKPNTVVMEREGSLGGEEIAMQIDAAATAHIMSVLTDLYSNTILAVVREYSTNALDAHIAVGQTRPIEVTTPTAMSPFFKVKDYGIGLDVDDIRKIYSQYGASTKRNSDDFNGVLGLGCKSALTYTNQFSVTSVKDGYKTAVSVSRSQDGGGSMTVVGITPTTDSNYTEVTVPTRDLKFEVEAKRFFRFWKKGTVLLNGAEPEGLPTTAKKVVDGIYMVPGFDSDYVVMGNVAYPVEKELYADRGWGYGYNQDNFGVVAFVDMGRVHFTPSREKLMMTPQTQGELTRIRREFKAGLHKQMRDDIESAPTHAEAYDRYVVWSNSFRNNVPNTYKGQTIPTSFTPILDARDKTNTTYPTATTYNAGSGRYSVSEGVRNVGVKDLRGAVLVTEYDGLKISPSHKKKMIQWAQNNGGHTNLFVLTRDKDMGNPWVRPRTVTWADVKAEKLPRQQAQRTQRKAPYDVIQPGGGIKQESNITATDILYVSPTEEVLQDTRWGYKGVNYATRDSLRKCFPSATIVVIAANRFAKFARDYPNAVHVRKYAEKHLTATHTALTEDDKLWLSISDEYTRAAMAKLDPTKIDDPEVVKYIQAATVKTNGRIDAYQNAKTVGRRFGIPVPGVATVANPMGKYPLVDSGDYSRNREHIYMYMNAIYAARQAGTSV